MGERAADVSDLARHAVGGGGPRGRARLGDVRFGPALPRDALSALLRGRPLSLAAARSYQSAERFLERVRRAARAALVDASGRVLRDGVALGCSAPEAAAPTRQGFGSLRESGSIPECTLGGGGREWREGERGRGLPGLCGKYAPIMRPVILASAFLTAVALLAVTHYQHTQWRLSRDEVLPRAQRSPGKAGMKVPKKIPEGPFRLHIATVSDASTACGRLEAPLYFSDGAGVRAAALADCRGCLDELEASTRFGELYYDAVPLVSTRLLQLQSYAWADGTDSTRVFEGFAARREALAGRIDPAAARPAATRAVLDEALANYGECKRSGRAPNSTCRKDPDEKRSKKNKTVAYYSGGVAGPTEASGTLLVHLHLTFHGGTNLLALIKKYSCVLLPDYCAAISNSIRKPLRNIASDREKCAFTPCPGNGTPEVRAEAGWTGGDDPVDAVFFEPRPSSMFPFPNRAWARGNVGSSEYIFSIIVRHPAFFALTRTLTSEQSAEFLLEKLASKSYPPLLCAAILPTEIARASANLTHAKSEFNDCTAKKNKKERSSSRLLPSRADLVEAKFIARALSVVVVAEHMDVGLLAFHEKLGWGDAWHSDAHVTEVKTSMSRKPKSGPPHHDARAALAFYGFTPAAFAGVVDASQLSTELYYFARELNRAWHGESGLAPPSTRLAPPGELIGILF